MMTRRLAWAFVTLLGVMLWPLAVRAEGPKTLSFVVQLDVAPTDTPDVVCLLTTTPGDGWAPVPQVSGWGLPQWLTDEMDQLSGQAARATWSVGPASTHADRLCGDQCSPKVQLDPRKTSSLYFRCERNDASFHVAGDDEGRLLVAEMEVASPAYPQFEAFRVLGDVITAEVKASGSESPVWTARTLGAHYAAQTGTTTSRGNVIALPLTRACTRHIVSVPPFIRRDPRDRTKSRSFTLSLRHLEGLVENEEGENDICRPRSVPFVEGRAEVLLPANPEERTLELSAIAPDGSAVFQAMWTDRRAPAVIRTQATMASFSWRVPCIAPPNECPAALLTESGVRCAAVTPVPSVVSSDQPDGGPPASESSPARAHRVCRYVCPGGHNAPNTMPVAFEIPSNVQFTDSNDRLWTLRLGYANQELDGYVGPAEHSIVVDFARWVPNASERAEKSCDAGCRFSHFVNRPHERIDHVELSEEGHPPLRITPTIGTTTLHVPGVACDDNLIYGIVGDREYGVRPLPVKDDAISLPPPQDLVRDVISPGATLGVGLYSPFGVPALKQSRVYGVAEGVATVRPFATNDVNAPTLFLFRPWFDLRAGYLLSSVWYNGITVPPTDPKTPLPYVRVPLSATIQWPLSDKLSAGVGGGVAIELPLFHHDQVIAGPLRTSGMLLVTGDYWLTQLIGLELALRVIPEEIVTYSTSGFTGVPIRGVSTGTSWFGEFKLRVGR